MASAITIEKISAEQQCDQLLAAAGLRQRWLPPEDLSYYMMSKAAKVEKLNSKEELSDVDRLLLRRFGSEVVKFSQETLRKNGYTGPSSFRASPAITRGIANCIGVHEIVSGTLSKAGLAKFALGTWEGRHASTYYMIGETRIHVDGQYEGAVLMNGDTEPQKRPSTEIYQRVLAENLVAAYKYTPEGIPLLDDLTLVKPDEISSLGSIGINTSLTMPAATATLLYIATQAQRGGPKFEEAAEVLRPFALAA